MLRASSCLRRPEMQTVIIYDTFTSNGNTGQIARAIARGVGSLGDVRVLSVAEAIPSLPEPLDLLLVGGPTQRHGLTPDCVGSSNGYRRAACRA